MARTKWMALATGVLLTLFAATAMAAHPQMTWSGQKTTMEKKMCMQHAESALRKAGFKADFYIDEAHATLYGAQGDYIASVRCFLDVGFVVFIVSGPDGTETGRLHDLLQGEF